MGHAQREKEQKEDARARAAVKSAEEKPAATTTEEERASCQAELDAAKAVLDKDLIETEILLAEEAEAEAELAMVKHTAAVVAHHEEILQIEDDDERIAKATAELDDAKKSGKAVHIAVCEATL